MSRITAPYFNSCISHHWSFCHTASDRASYQPWPCQTRSRRTRTSRSCQVRCTPYWSSMACRPWWHCYGHAHHRSRRSIQSNHLQARVNQHTLRGCATRRHGHATNALLLTTENVTRAGSHFRGSHTVGQRVLHVVGLAPVLVTSLVRSIYQPIFEGFCSLM